MKKTVVFISLGAYPLFNKNIGGVHGGAELDLYNIATHLDKSLFDIHFIVGDYGQSRHENIQNIQVHRGQKITRSGNIGGIKNFLRLFFLIKKINPDIIFSEAAGWITVEIILIKILLGKKFIFRSSHENNINGVTDSRPYGLLYRKLINKIDCFILQNNQDFEILKSVFHYKKKTILIRNLQEIPLSPPLPQKDRAYFLWVGRSEKVKNPWLIIDLAKRLPLHRFIMIMPNTNQFIFEDIEKKSADLINMTFVPGVKWGEIMPYFKSATYFINTSTAEGFPNVILEAMKYGTPIISAELDFDNIFKEHECGIIGGTTSEALASTIRNIDEKSWETYSKNAYKFSIDNFDISKGIKEYEKLFLQI